MKVKLTGIHHPIEIRFVTKRYLRRIAGETDPEIDISGFYNSNKALIYVDKSLPPTRKLHTLMHELVHHILDSTEDMKEETKCDVIGKWMIEVFNLNDIKDFL